MNIVQSGDKYQVYGDALKTYSKLPLGTYEVQFHKMTGFYLTSHDDLVVNEKIYGNTPVKIEKVLESFARVERNFGVILSGRKGIGKSLFARQLAVRAKDYNLPLIIVSRYYPGIADFISSIKQEVIVFFDEFEKTFADSDSNKPQEEMLPLFDGVDDGKKLFIITCNEVQGLSSYLINRPGRFHYHFNLGNPSSDEIKEYMTDKLNSEYHGVIKGVVGFALGVDITYDMLRAIAFEINNGYSLEETLQDLNICNETIPRYDITMKLSDGTTYTASAKKINTYSSDEDCVWFHSKERLFGDIRLSFYPTDIAVSKDGEELTIDPSLVERYVDMDDYDLKNPEDKDHYDYLNNINIAKITFSKISDISVRKYVV